MRILLLIDWPYPCDHPFLENVYAEQLVERGHEVVWVMRPSTPRAHVEHHTWNGQSVYVVPNGAYDPIRTAVNVMIGRIESHPVVSIVEQEGSFDLVQVRNDLAMGLVATYLREDRSLPMVQQITHLKAETELEMARERLGGHLARRYLKGMAGRHVRNRIANQADLVFPISVAMKSYLAREGVESPMVPVSTGADTSLTPDQFDELEFRDRFDIPDSPLLLYMGTMAPIRRLEFLFDVLNRVRDESDAHLAMVGGRTDANRQRLQAAAVDAGVRDAVTFTGWISSNDLLNCGIVAADVGVSPIPTGGVLEMNAPLKTIEYLNLETPVVATDTSDQRRVITDSGGGIVTPYDVEAFAAAVLSLLEAEDRGDMGRRGRAYVEEDRSYDHIRGTVLAAYDEYIHQ